MDKKYPTAERLRELFSYDEGSNSLIYKVAPYRKPAFLGTRAGRMDKRDLIEYVSVDGKLFLLKHIVSLHQTGELPPKNLHHLQLTAERLRQVLHYDPNTGVFTRIGRERGAKVGSRADYKEHNGYRCAKVDGTRHLAARLAWLYVHGEWPKRMLRFQDGDTQNCSIINLAYGEFDHTDPEQKKAYDKRHRQRNPMWHRKQNLKRDCGISFEQYQAMFVEQDGVCACCRKPEITERDGKRKWLAVDHDHTDHTDNTIRGLLCTNCNNGLGRMMDDPAVLRRAADYIEAHRAKPITNIIPLAGRRATGTQGGTT